ncbi:MAG: Asp-tRNA(Asn)/Glu-tRNA(Gln) amidotransferase subunit GatB [Bacilli bacterium]|nr:Asp-tRNA(Asn)/Glu-tRNA(Gln) amidotransferase subunit GatB [Bacilli bacterium]
MSNYIPTIGIEVHVELKTNTKIFSSSKNGYGMSANSLTNVIDLGYPGTLPVINEAVVNKAIKAAKVLNCKIRRKMHFDRKNYFYPDNPKNYQITQAETPIGYDGYVPIIIDGKEKRIEIEEMHIEEDTCKSMHRGNVSLLDFNRAGVPLIEIVTKPCISSPEEAKLYIEKLRETLLYADISDCKIEEGSMRCDANVSIRKSESDPLGTKAEIKNIGSISNVKLSLEKEIERQTKLYDNGETFLPQTRRFDSKLNDTVLMRIKETGNDYRYFPEPDIPFLNLTEDMIESAIKEIPMMPDERREVYVSRGVSEVNSDKMINHREMSDFLNLFIDTDLDFKTAVNLLLGDIASYLNKNNKELCDTKLDKDKFYTLVTKVNSNELTSKNVKELISDILESDKSIDELIEEKGISNITDNSQILEIISSVISENPDSVTDFRNGHDRAIKYLMGQVMKKSQGKADPRSAMELLNSELEKLK